jgi:hypothetical protein
MTYEDFLRIVQERAGLASVDEAERVVEATFRTLRDSLGAGDTDALPAELRNLMPEARLVPSSLMQASGGEMNNPQLIGEERAESGGESTAESGQ